MNFDKSTGSTCVRRTFKFRKMELLCQLEFFDDRMDYIWDTFGWGIERGKRSTHRQELSPDLAESIGSLSLSIPAKLFLFGCILMVILIHLLLEPPWVYIEYIFLASIVLHVAHVVLLIRDREWINVFRNDGALAVSVQVATWSVNEREEFKRFYLEWVNSRN